jgi:hypothetical protein
MPDARPRRVTCCIVVTTFVLIVAACHGGGAQSLGSPETGRVDVKGACAALSSLHRSSDALNGVEVGDPGASTAALAKAVHAYSTALSTFERLGPVNLRARAEAARVAVLAHNFSRAAVARTAIDAWSERNCTS